nr:unnamed protein product [Callosobruchus analis]
MRDLSGSFQPLEKYLDLNIIPFGKSHSYVDSSSVQFQCQHGPRECRGNKLVSCALNRLTDQNAKVQFTYCFMVKYFFKMSDDFTQCANEAGINIKDVLSCSVSDEATQLQLQMETITNNYAITFVPTIVYNKKYSSDLQAKSLVSFKGTVCEILRNISSAAIPECVS